MKVSVLIGSRNRPLTLSYCLKSVMSQDYPQFEVIVLDDASDDAGSYRALIGTYPGLRLIRSDCPLGVAGGRRKLVSMASGDVLCFIDDDAYFEDSTAISRFVSVFQKDHRIGIVASKIIDHRQSKTDLLVPFSRRARRQNPHLTEEPRFVSYYLGGCHAISMKVIEHCGMYHDGLVFGEEELDLSYRVIAEGYRVYYEPKIVVHHYPQPSVVISGPTDQGDRGELYFHIRNRFYLAYRYLPSQYIPIYLFLWLGKYALDAVKLSDMAVFFKGLRDGIKALKEVKRESLSTEAVSYLKHNCGRLWY